MALPYNSGLKCPLVNENLKLIVSWH